MTVATIKSLVSVPRLSLPGLARRLRTTEEVAAAAALLIMASLPIAESVVRLVYPSGIPGAANWVQYLTLWVAFLGAMIAARRGELLAINVGENLFSGRIKATINVFTTGVGVAVCSFLAWAGYQVVAVERQAGAVLSFGIPVWLTVVVMPLGFAVIAVRLLTRLPEAWQRAAAASFVLFPLALTRIEDPSVSAMVTPAVIALIVAVFLGAPIFVGLAGIGAVLLWSDFWPAAHVASRVYGLVLEPFLPTIPLFTLAGFILAEGGTPKRLVRKNGR